MATERLPDKHQTELKFVSQDFKWSLLQHKTSGKAKNQMRGRGPERCIATIRNEKMEEKSKKW